ncbi:MAG TPA: LptA/OstA family protein [Myxococcaceae bacterium]|nr:LptA/OstA family protein [Myxococcaceae bacterium]
MIEYFLMAFFAAGAQDGGTGSSAGTDDRRGVAPADFKNPVHITAERFEIQGKRQAAIWMGKVKAVRGRTVLTCDRLVAHYTKSQEITHIECSGDVEATHGDMWARGERADFDNVTGILVVTGSPQARKGANAMKGSRITFDVTRDTILIDNAQTVFESSSTRVLPKPGARRQEPK